MFRIIIAMILFLGSSVTYSATNPKCANIPMDVEVFYKKVLAPYYNKRCPMIQLIIEHFPNEPEVALAIAMQESSLKTYARNTKGRDNSTGLYQINIKKAPKIHDLDKKTPSEAIKYLKNPLNNVRVAKEMRERFGWTSWGAYTSGKFRKYLIPRKA